MYFDYHCADCNYTQEESHGMLERPDIKCSKCGKTSTRLITGGTGFSLKGQGWCSSGVSSIIKPILDTKKDDACEK